IKDSDVIILAVKPWILPDVVAQIAPHIDEEKHIIVSVAGGVDFFSFERMFYNCCDDKKIGHLRLFRVIPNTAIAVGKGMTFVCSQNDDAQGIEMVKYLFSLMGEVAVIDENHIDAGTALCSCGIAYVFKAVQAAVQAGVQLGFRPTDALRYVNATVEGAVALLQQDGALPQSEIDKVTTPGGMTIKGVNQLEHDAFPSAIINAILAPLSKK
ncbi:MAG: pyrroline-5-carboxylate reductase, partial [Muribaculaceae bacterium]|nr:pyrroline-5-carboxylate reductase [Muribaculaceae bacterium]